MLFHFMEHEGNYFPNPADSWWDPFGVGCFIYDRSSDWEFGKILGITGWVTSYYPSVCKSNRLYVDILRLPYIELGFIL